MKFYKNTKRLIKDIKKGTAPAIVSVGGKVYRKESTYVYTAEDGSFVDALAGRLVKSEEELDNLADL